MSDIHIGDLYVENVFAKPFDDRFMKLSFDVDSRDFVRSISLELLAERIKEIYSLDDIIANFGDTL